MDCGEYVALAKVESELKTNPLVENICVYGQAMSSFCTALICPNPAKLKMLAQTLDLGHKSFNELCLDANVTQCVLKELFDHGIMAGLKKFELPANVTLVKEDWTPDTGLVTAGFKIRRNEIKKFYQKEICLMYGETNGINKPTSLTHG